jgi:hypothetical protein
VKCGLRTIVLKTFSPLARERKNFFRPVEFIELDFKTSYKLSHIPVRPIGPPYEFEVC